MRLKKELNLIDLFCIATGAMISSGLFVLPSLAYIKSGASVVISYFLAGILALIGVLNQMELVTAMPKSGGIYFYVMRSLGPALGTINGLLVWFSLSLKSAFALIGMAAFLESIVNLNIHLVAVILCIFFIILNIIGIKQASSFQKILVSVLLFLLLIYILKGIGKVEVRNFEPLFPYGVSKVFSVAGFIFISYGGVLKIASISEEVKNPARNLPLAMIISLAVVSILYTSVVFVTVGVCGNSLKNTLMPISLGAYLSAGKIGEILLSIGAILAFVSTANSGIISASRYPLALSRDKLLPSFFEKIHKRFATPYISIIFTGLFIISMLFLEFNLLIETASVVLILTYVFSSLCVIILRESRLGNYQPTFSVPFYPWIQIAGIIIFSSLILIMGKEAIFLSLVLVIGSFLFYWFYGRIRSRREYALLHLVERITSKELTTRILEDEFREIIRERDEITKDRFDEIIERSIILDIEEELDWKKFFSLVAEKLSFRLNLEKNYLYQLLLKREKESSTVLSSYLAIPHIVIEGKNTFDILLARCKRGVNFPQGLKVFAVFVLVGTKDERNFHLYALSAIAQIVSNPHFEKKWMQAKDKEALRDVILLGKRKRL